MSEFTLKRVKRWLLLECFFYFIFYFFTSPSPWCVFDMHDQDSAYRASGEDSGHSPEHVGHGGEGGADPPAYHGQQQRYDSETHTHTHTTLEYQL